MGKDRGERHASRVVCFIPTFLYTNKRIDYMYGTEGEARQQDGNLKTHICGILLTIVKN